MAPTFSDKTNTIKWLGILTMTLDHIGYFLFPGVMWLRIVGRIAFPCFLYGVIEGTERTYHYPRYVGQLFLLGVLSMPVTPNTLNVLFLLAFFSLSLKYPKYFIVFLLFSNFVEYGVYGFLFGWALWWMKNKNKKEGVFGSVFVQLFSSSSIQFFSLLALPFLLWPKGVKLPRLPKSFFYFYYPLHQLILMILAR